MGLLWDLRDRLEEVHKLDSKEFVGRVVYQAGRNVEDLLTDKRVWVAVFGVAAALNQWLGWEVPQAVFIAVEGLMGALIVAWKYD